MKVRLPSVKWKQRHLKTKQNLQAKSQLLYRFPFTLAQIWKKSVTRNEFACPPFCCLWGEDWAGEEILTGVEKTGEEDSDFLAVKNQRSKGRSTGYSRHSTGKPSAAVFLLWTNFPMTSLQELAVKLWRVMSGIIVIRGTWKVGCLSRSFIHSAAGQAMKVLHLFVIVMHKGSLSFCLNSNSFGTL